MNTAHLSAIEDEVLERLIIAEEAYGQTFPIPKITLDVKGRCAGKANAGSWRLMFNPILYKENIEDYHRRTIPHEVAHLVADRLYNSIGHDRPWKQVCLAIGMTDIERCHNYDATSVTPGGVMYKCGCMEYLFTKIRHNKVLRNGTKYRCKHCGEVFKEMKGE